MKKVFVPELPTRYDQATNSRVPSIDLNPAVSYGHLSIAVSEHTLPYTEKLMLIKAHLAAFMEPDDCILAVGDVILVAAAVAYANDLFGNAKVLRWDKKSKNYYTVEVEL